MVMKQKLEAKQTCDSFPCAHFVDSVDRANERWICWANCIVCRHVSRSFGADSFCHKHPLHGRTLTLMYLEPH